MRLGLLLGDNARHSARAVQSPPRRPGSAANRISHSHESCASISSLASLEAHTLASTNTSPVSTLTGMSRCQQDCTLRVAAPPIMLKIRSWKWYSLLLC